VGKRLEIKEVDLKVMQSLWKWKMATTASIGEEFYANPYSEGAYKRLHKLAKAGFIESVPLTCEKYIWVLTRAGFNLIKPYLPVLKDEGFKSEALEHDYLCSALQRGPWISKLPEDVILCSEQELRRFKSDHYPQNIPDSEVHRADGYSIIPIKKESQVIAFEVELNSKNKSDYRVVAKFYERQSHVFRVIWLVESLSFAKWIQKIICDATPENYLAHDFILLNDYKNLGWNAPIILGYEQGETLSYLLEYDQAPKRLPGATSYFLEATKRPYKSNVYKISQKNNFSNRLAIVGEAS
jgi:hypothetical protein